MGAKNAVACHFNGKIGTPCRPIEERPERRKLRYNTIHLVMATHIMAMVVD